MFKQAAVTMLSLGTLSVGCGSSNPEANNPDQFSAEGDMQASAEQGTETSESNAPAMNESASQPTPPMDENATQVTIDRSLVEQCGLDEAKLYFPYDSAEIKGNGDDRVRSMADCLTSGNLRGKQLQLVGHADPRGTEAYNKELGKSRAESIADLLMSAGMPKDKLVVQSKGEAGASDDKDEWPNDRRVEVSVVSD